MIFKSQFTKKQLLCSLLCPALTFLWGLFNALYAVAGGLEFTGKGIFRLSLIAAMAIGGVLSAVLTLAFDIHTEYYLDKRLILIFAVFVFHSIINRFMVGSDLFYIVLFLMVGAAAYIVLFVKIRDINTDFGELAVIILSDPVLYWTAYWTLLYLK